MGEWKRVSRCKTCGKIYSDGIPEICRKCGTVIAKHDNIAALFTDRCMSMTENSEYVVARRKFFKWEFKREAEFKEEKRLAEKDKIEKWIENKGYCSYCIYKCENAGVIGSPSGPLYPPCADWNEEKMMQSLDIDSILQDIEDEQSIEDIFQDK